MRRLACILLAGLLSACADGLTSEVGTISERDAQTLGPAIAEFVALRLRPNAGPIQVDAPRGDVTLAPAVENALRAAGYTVAAGPAPHRLDYQAGALDDGVLLRLSLDGGDAARYFRRSPLDGLQASGPFSIRSAS